MNISNNDLITHDYCPSCGYNEWTPFKNISYYGIKLEYQLCGKCCLLFLNPVPSQVWYNKLYANEFWECKSAQKSNSEIYLNQHQWEKEFRRMEKFIDFLSNIKMDPGSFILEIGCAYGLIVNNLASYFNAVPLGVEPSPKVRNFAEHIADVKIISENMDDLDKWEPEYPVCMIVFSHVMENIVHLDNVFKIARKLLADDGLILMDTPNLFFTSSLHIYHPYCFCKKSLFFLFSRHGFEILSAKASGRPHSVTSPKYLTVLARKQPHKLKLIPEQHRIERKVSLKIKIGHLWYRLANMAPISYFDKSISRRLYSIKNENIERLNTIREKARSFINSELGQD